MRGKTVLIGAALLMAAGIGFAASGAMGTLSQQKAAPQPNLTNRVETAAREDEKTGNATEGKKILIAYFSHTGNTGKFAEEIKQEVGGDLFAIEPETAYPADYDSVVKQAREEVDSGYTPKLKNDTVNTDAYDVIFIGTPIWWYTFAPPVRSFLTGHDLSGKIIIPFSTHKGSGLSGIDGKIKEFQPRAKVLGGLAVWHDTAGKERANIAEWLKELKI